MNLLKRLWYRLLYFFTGRVKSRSGKVGSFPSSRKIRLLNIVKKMLVALAIAALFYIIFYLLKKFEVSAEELLKTGAGFIIISAIFISGFFMGREYERRKN